mmetsp:Transcript_32492/g.52027  ORF Transcript_32492/g.52027 Transcript_32492/m.52027 type:complete len:251 (+) Transcript_32492:374-1126(+)
MNDADAANITRNEMLSRVSPCRSAASAAMGNMSAAAALLVTTLLMRKVAKYTATRSPARPVPESSASWTSFAATVPATPLFCSARLMPKAAAMVTMTSHLTALRASCSLSAPHAIMMAAAKMAAMSRFITPAVNSVIMAMAMRMTGTSRRRRGGALSSSTDTSANPLPLCPASRWKSGPASRSNTSPGSKTTSPIRACTRTPSRCTASTTALYRERNLVSRMLLPTSGPVFATTAWTSRRSWLFPLSLST